MIKAIFFDFDGVILESADIKTEAFAELFKQYPAELNEIVEFHLQNMGISRYVKFRHIYENILKKKLSKDYEEELGREFSKIVFQKIVEAPFVNGAVEFLKANYKKYKLFIASGTPEQELKEIVELRKLGSYFTEIHGSPKKKAEIINMMLKKNNIEKKEALFVGDAESDRKAASETKVFFVERNKNKEELPGVIKDLKSLEKAISLL